MVADETIDRVDSARAGAAGTRTLAGDPPPTTPFDVVYESRSLRLRRYRAEGAQRRGPPVLLVYSLFKRPYVLDLLPDRSVVRNFVRQGFSVYLTDWLPPEPADARRGLAEYVNGDLAGAVECVRRLEAVSRIALVGCCLGGFLATVYAALNPASVERLVVFALPFDSRPPFAPAAAGYFAGMLGNIPTEWIRAGLNANLGARDELPAYLARELDEPELARADRPSAVAVHSALAAWFGSDVPLTGRLFAEIMGDAYGRGQFAASRLVVGDRPVMLADIRCPVLNVCAEHDRLVPVQESLPFIRHVGSSAASNLVFKSGHIGLMVGRAAHEHLWPHVGRWLATGDAAATDTGARRPPLNATGTA
jgi:polyhydroxyalkanoate synthase